MVALGELGLTGRVESEFDSLFVRDSTACRFAGIYHVSGRIDTNLYDHFAFLFEIVGRLRQRTSDTSSCQTPTVVA